MKAEFDAQNTVVWGVSPDGPESHQHFISKFGFNFDLLCDEDHAMSTAYDAYGERKMYGKTFMGMIRSSVLVDEEGVVIKRWKVSDAEAHPGQVLAFLKG